MSKIHHKTAGLSSVGLFAALACACCAQAAPSPIPHGTVELISEDQWIAAGRTVNFGLHFQLEKGWHIYWINPGDSGEPPRIKWQLPTGLTPGEIQWPAPQRLGTSSIVDFGYQDAVTLIVPIHVAAELQNQPSTQLAAQISVLVCREMCIPGKTQVALTVPFKPQPPATDSRTSELFAATRKSLPRQAPANWKFSLGADKDSLMLTANLGHQATQALFFPLLESQIDNAAPQKLKPTPKGFQLSLRKSDRLLNPIAHLQGVLVLAPDQAYAIDVPLAKSSVATTGYGIATHPAISSQKGVSE